MTVPTYTERELSDVRNYITDVKLSHKWVEILRRLNDRDIDYRGWEDIDIIIWALKNNYNL